jgi:hypothetical protein
MTRAAFVTLGLAGALALVAAPAAAQHQRSGGGGEHHDGTSPRTDSHRESVPAPQVRPRESRPAPRQEEHAVPRQDQRAAPRDEFRATPRTYAPHYEPRYDSGRYYGPRYVGPRLSIAPRRFFRPYYLFHPRLSIGFGIWSGYPISYYDPYYYYLLPPSGSMSVQPSQSNMGGLSFEITPDTAEVWVDGNYAGTVDQFTPNSQPLGLTAGRHHIELREPGYQVIAFEVDIVPGQVIPYSGALEN